MKEETQCPMEEETKKLQYPEEREIQRRIEDIADSWQRSKRETMNELLHKQRVSDALRFASLADGTGFSGEQRQEFKHQAESIRQEIWETVKLYLLPDGVVDFVREEVKRQLQSLPK